MQDPTPEGVARWASQARLNRHFRRHGGEVGAPDAASYDASARQTIRTGVRFTYRDLITQEMRIGFFDPSTGRFTALSEDGTTILTHFVTTETYIRSRPDLTYLE